ncbi:DUF1289 domain-containing protein [Sinirhodobacter huangdaonensis]|uniref:DUF1289 domain-containing protein n=2 Tax=Paenirhodobacter huangdaonensis TaxID=2501515 RepID=A0A443LXA0_9RHOB|nr:DUF1289 domain-containing protein [Sinirhodobacter huangdaonensis]RWR53837.1 DUF1289 domain-containing protein [Sinirhodobacter huangdaonensis]
MAERGAIESPCRKLCALHPETKVCTGCFRSLEEIGRWARMTPAERRAVMADLAARARAWDLADQGGAAPRPADSPRDI